MNILQHVGTVASVISCHKFTFMNRLGNWSNVFPCVDAWATSRWLLICIFVNKLSLCRRRERSCVMRWKRRFVHSTLTVICRATVSFRGTTKSLKCSMPASPTKSKLVNNNDASSITHTHTLTDSLTHSLAQWLWSLRITSVSLVRLHCHITALLSVLQHTFWRGGGGYHTWWELKIFHITRTCKSGLLQQPSSNSNIFKLLMPNK